MLFGHNTNVTVGELQYHVQTEDRGVAHPVIDSSVYLCGRVVHRRKNDYSDLLPLDAEKESILKQRVDAQHAGIEEELRTGLLKFDMGAETGRAPELKVQLLNGNGWLKGKQASLQVLVQDGEGRAVQNADIAAHFEGAATPVRAGGVSAADGQALIEFEMPALAGADATLIVEANAAAARGQLRFQLRARPKVPAV
jgi:hypothetical protein